LDMNLDLNKGVGDQVNSSIRQLEFASALEIAKDNNNHQLKKELEKENYDCYFLERVSNRETKDAPKIMLNDLAKAVVENHLNKKSVPATEQVNKSLDLNNLLNASYQNDGNHVLNTNFNQIENQQSELLEPHSQHDNRRKPHKRKKIENEKKFEG